MSASGPQPAKHDGIDPRPLAGRRILIVEDDYYLATDAAAALRAAGATVVGPVATSDQVIAIADIDLDCAVIDVKLGDHPTFAPAEHLSASGVAILFLTAYDNDVLPQSMRACGFLQKPVVFSELIKAVDAMTR